jgi:hypothetical protein
MKNDRPDFHGRRRVAIAEIDARAVESQQTCPSTAVARKWALGIRRGYRQEGSQICMFHVDWEIGMPVRIGYIHAKFVMTRAT